jgi:biopolymer transport protein ExbD
MGNYKLPSRRHAKPAESGSVNLVPMIDSIFNLIFFVMISANFMPIHQITSPIPIVSDKEPKDEKNPLNLTLEIEPEVIHVKTGLNNDIKLSLKKINNQYPIDELHAALLDFKKKFPQEASVIFLPNDEIDYRTLVKLMDSVKILSPTDEAIYYQNKEGVSIKAESLFSDIIYGNINS